MNEMRDFFNKYASSRDERDTTDLTYVKNVLINKSLLKENDLVLDVGCGTGIITGFIFDITKNNVKGIDVSDEMIKIAKNKYKNNKKIEFINEDFYDYKSEERVDEIIIFNAYPHFLDLKRLKESFKNNLKENGKVLIFSTLGIKKINDHHKNVSVISRFLTSIDEEIKVYQDEFNILKKEDLPSGYLLLMELK